MRHSIMTFTNSIRRWDRGDRAGQAGRKRCTDRFRQKQRNFFGAGRCEKLSAGAIMKYAVNYR
jgi:hypothetical protein